MCMECGLVLEQLYGGGGGGERWRGGVSSYATPPKTLNPWEGGKEKEEITLEYVFVLLGTFHMDTDDTAYRVWELFKKIYKSRQERLGFRKTTFKAKVAVAFCLCNTLAHEHSPRPIESITTLIGLDSVKPLLDIPKSLNLSPCELESLRKHEYELIDPSPQEYIDTICAHLNISFSIAGQIRQKVEQVEWLLYGKQPTVIAAAGMQSFLSATGHLEGNMAKDICALLGCQQKAVNAALSRIKM